MGYSRAGHCIRYDLSVLVENVMSILFRSLVIMLLLSLILAFIGEVLRTMEKNHYKRFGLASNILSAICLVIMVVIAVFVLVGR